MMQSPPSPPSVPLGRTVWGVAFMSVLGLRRILSPLPGWSGVSTDRVILPSNSPGRTWFSLLFEDPATLLLALLPLDVLIALLRKQVSHKLVDSSNLLVNDLGSMFLICLFRLEIVLA